ncbi:LURP-one-related protein [Dioscorea alata]|uniref:LURP-one-related protein n=1 Tax=Dioscorea alata TaxID=55571 RepID=A0ACB7VFH8_DIOAL|nr:LURP-one-related protein [Dioscorea alata]
MTKVHPNSGDLPENGGREVITGTTTTLTVWHKSLLFNCNGFTVYDDKGNLVFRVDNYSSTTSGEVVLMDAAGKPLLTVRRKKLSLTDQWLIYNGEEMRNPRFTARKHMNILQSKSLTQVSTCQKNSSVGAGCCYNIEGSYTQRSCMIYDERHNPVAEIKRKEDVGGVAFGGEVFRLVVQPEIESTLAMAIVVLLDQMFGSKSALSLIRS